MNVFRSPRFGRRLGALVLLLALAFVSAWLVGQLSDMPSGYGGSQSDGACTLALRPHDWASLVHGTTHDLLVFIPAYVVIGLVAVYLTRRPERGNRLAAALIIAMAAADVIETLLFRRTLEHLQGGEACRDLTTATDVTRAFTVAKFGFLFLFVADVTWRVLRPPAPTTESTPE
jgi:hypothetical protein